MLKLKFNAGNKKISYKSYSISIKYFIDNKKLSQNLKQFEKVSNIKLSELQRKTFLSEKGKEVIVSRPQGKPDEFYIVKIKLDESFSSDFFRNHLAGMIQKISGEIAKNLHIFIPKYSDFKSTFDNEEYFYQTFAEGIALGNYSFDKYKKLKETPAEINIYFYSDNEKKLKNQIRKS